MHTDTQMKLVGVIMGSIVQDSAILVYYLYANNTQGFEKASVEFPGSETRQNALFRIKQTFGLRIRRIWRNDACPCWYYIQIDDRYPTRKLAYWDLPITIYFARWENYPSG